MNDRELRQTVLKANLDLWKMGLALHTWGNASQIDRGRGIVAIKPSGVPYGELTPECVALVDMDGKIAGGALRPSSDTPAHLALYRAFPGIGGVVHTHSIWATVWAQAGLPIPCLGTTHADYFHGPVPCTRPITPGEIRGEYEAETGAVLVETLGGADPMRIPAALVSGHGPFAWGADADGAVFHAAVLEQAAQMAWAARLLNPSCGPISQDLLDRHYLRKHGGDAYYGNPPAPERRQPGARS